MSWKMFLALALLCIGAITYAFGWWWTPHLMVLGHGAFLVLGLGMFVFFWLFGEKTGAIAEAPPGYDE